MNLTKKVSVTFELLVRIDFTKQALLLSYSSSLSFSLKHSIFTTPITFCLMLLSVHSKMPITELQDDVATRRAGKYKEAQRELKSSCFCCSKPLLKHIIICYSYL